MTDAAAADPLILVEAQHRLRMIVGYTLRCRELPLYRFVRCESSRDLDVYPFPLPPRDEIDLTVAKLSDV